MDRPGVTSLCVYDRHLQIVLEQRDNAGDLPAAAVDIDAVGAGMRAPLPFDVGINRFDGHLADLRERHVERLHRQALQAAAAEILEDNLGL